MLGSGQFWGVGWGAGGESRVCQRSPARETKLGGNEAGLPRCGFPAWVPVEPPQCSQASPGTGELQGEEY